MPVSETQITGVRRLGGKILTAKGGDPTAAIRQHPVLARAVTEPISRMTPQQRILHNAAVMRHEMAEQAIRGPKTKQMTPFRIMTGHMGAEAPLTDVNVLATLPKGSRAVRETMQAYRPLESELLEEATRGVGGRAGLEFGTQRLSRHAKKKVSRRMEEIARERFQETLADPEQGAAVRQMLRSQGIGEVAGIGKLSSAQGVSEAVARKEKTRLVRKAGPGIGGLVGAGVGALVGAKKGKLLKGTLAGLGTGATLGWTPDMYHSAREAIRRYRRKVQ
jgi:hypothetical protein